MSLGPTYFDGTTFFNDGGDGDVTTQSTVVTGGGAMSTMALPMRLADRAASFVPAPFQTLPDPRITADVQYKVCGVVNPLTNNLTLGPIANVDWFGAYVRIEKRTGPQYWMVVIGLGWDSSANGYVSDWDEVQLV